MELKQAIEREAGERRLESVEEYTEEMITHLQQENIRLYMENKRLKLLLDFNREMCDHQNGLIVDLLGIIRKDNDADRA